MSVNGADLFDHGLFLVAFGRENGVGFVDADHGAIGRNHLHIHAVEAPELFGLRGGRAGHAAGLRIERHQILQGDGGQHAALLAERQSLLGFERRVQARRPAAVRRDAALELVHRFDGAVFHDVVHIAAQQRVGVDGVMHRRV